ncbi:MAG: hypothetical protein JWQ57_4858 [Mucilaginibacter sp.]|nr:hypothetical protein [Mucilaginibacter sp.]
MKKLNKDQDNNYAGINKKLSLFLNIILIYLAFVCLIVGLNFLANIRSILSVLNLGSIISLILLIIYFFILIINLVFLIRKRKGNFRNVILFNLIFSVISGISLRLSSYIIAHNLGADISLVYINAFADKRIFIHADLFNFIVQFKHLDTVDPAFGFQINFIMWGIGAFLLFCYKRIPHWLNRLNQQE